MVAQQLAENWPEIVEAGAGAFGNVEHMVLLNGADGMSEMFAKALTMGGTGLGLARQLLSTMSQGDGRSNGGTEAAPPVNGVAPAVPPTPRKEHIPVTVVRRAARLPDRSWQLWPVPVRQPRASTGHSYVLSRPCPVERHGAPGALRSASRVVHPGPLRVRRTRLPGMGRTRSTVSG